MKRKILLTLLLIALVTGVLYATTFKYVYTGETIYLQTNAYGGATADLAADGAYDYGADINLETNGYYGIWIFLEHDSAGTTDDIVIGAFGSFDGSTYDDVALFEIRCIATSGADLQQSFAVFPAPPHMRLGVKTTGTTDAFDYEINYHLVAGDGT